MKNGWVYCVALVVLTIAGGFIAYVRTSPIPDETAGYVMVLPKLGSPVERVIYYEASGPAGVPVTVSYLDENVRNRDVTTVLPWTQSLRTSSPVFMSALVVQSRTGGIGCRISVDGKIRNEQVSNSAAGVASCNVQVA